MNEELKIFIRAEIDDLKKNLSEAQKEVKETASKGESGFKKFGEAAKTAGKVVGAGLKVAGGAIAAAGAALFGLAESTVEFRQNQAQLNAAFEQAKLSAASAGATYKTLYGIIGDDDQAVESAANIAMLASSEKEAAEWAQLASGVLGTFHDTLQPEAFYEAANETLKLGEATGAFAQMLEQTGVMSVEDFNAELAQCTTEAEKQALMLSVSSKAMGEAGKAYEEGAADIIASNEAQADLNETMAKLGAIATPIMTTLKVLLADVLQSITPFVELLGTGLQGALEGNAGAADQFAEGLAGIVDTAIATITEMLPVVLELVTTLVPALLDVLIKALPDILTVIVDGIVMIIDAIAEMIPDIVDTIMEVLPELIKELVAAIPKLLDAAITLLMAIVEAIPTIIAALIAALPSIIDTIIDAVLEAFPMLIKAAIDLLMAIVKAIPTIVNALVNALPQIIDTIITGVLEALPILLEAAVELLMAIVEAIPEILPPLVAALPQIIMTINTTLLRNLPQIIKTAVELLLGIVKALPEVLPKLNGLTGDIIAAIVRGLKDGISKVKDIGKDIIKGLWNGIKDMGSWIAGKLEGFGDSVLGSIKSFFGIHSPSRVMEDQVGKYLAEGIGVGFMDEIDSVNKDIEKSMQPLTAARSFTVHGAFDGLAPIRAGGGNVAPINANSQWLDKLTDTMREDSRPIILKVGEKVFAETTFKAWNNYVEQTGSCPVKVW